MSAYVERTRVRDESCAAAMGFKNTPEIGAVRCSRTFPTVSAAQREADAWNGTGDWVAVVREGRAPRPCRVCRETTPSTLRGESSCNRCRDAAAIGSGFAAVRGGQR